MVLDGLRILFFQSTFPKKCKVGVRKDIEKNENGVFGKIFLGRKQRKINIFSRFGDFGTHFWGIKFHGNPVFGEMMADLAVLLGKEES